MCKSAAVVSGGPGNKLPGGAVLGRVSLLAVLEENMSCDALELG